MIRFLALLALCVFCFTCEKAFLGDEPADTPRENFEYLWNECRDKYSFFDIKGIDWDQIKVKYSPRIKEKMSSDSLFIVLNAMLNELRDGHVNLVSPFRTSQYSFALLGPENLDIRIVREKYLTPDFVRTGPFEHNWIANKKIAYVRYNSFSDRVAGAHVAYLLSLYRNSEGLIFDIRQNGGGSAANIQRILNQIVLSKTLLYNSYLKSGPGKDDFQGPQAAYSEPDENQIKYTKKIAVLIDRGTFSAASFFALGAREIPNVILVGDSTGGGLGIPNGGQLPNGWTYRFSISRTLSPAGENFENGVPPDVKVLLKKADRDQGIDTVIERAVEEVRK
jgi:hypothetical protein